MANQENLRVLTPEEAREIGSKGGKASVEARRRKKSMKELMESLLTSENEDQAIGKSLKKLGFTETDNIHMAKIVTSVMRKAEDGDLKAVDTIIKLLYGNDQNVNVNLEGNVTANQRVQIYLPERDDDPE